MEQVVIYTAISTVAVGGGMLYASRAVQFHPHGGQFDFVWRSARTMQPHVGPRHAW